MHFDVTTTEYGVDEVAKALDLNPNRFCLLASLLGNHILPGYELQEFHSRLAPPPPPPPANDTPATPSNGDKGEENKANKDKEKQQVPIVNCILRESNSRVGRLFLHLEKQRERENKEKQQVRFAHR